jgi:hypothetical protein
MQCFLYKIYFWKSFSYILQIDMHLIGTPMLTKFYSCKKWVLHIRLNETSWAHIWRLHIRYLGTWCDKWYQSRVDCRMPT